MTTSIHHSDPGAGDDQPSLLIEPCNSMPVQYVLPTLVGMLREIDYAETHKWILQNAQTPEHGCSRHILDDWRDAGYLIQIGTVRLMRFHVLIDLGLCIFVPHCPEL